jgi:MoaA/NifB/PqqE/SkfB family radical SAM enzyme
MKKLALVDTQPAMTLILSEGAGEGAARAGAPAWVEVLTVSGAAQRASLLEAAQGEVVLSLAPGCVPLPSALVELRALFAADQHLAFAYGDVTRVGLGGEGRSRLPAWEGKRRFLEAPFEPAALAFRPALLPPEAPLAGELPCPHAALIEALAYEGPGVLAERPLARLVRARDALPGDCLACSAQGACGVAQTRLDPTWSGPRWVIGKLALAVTTRCNLDCDYCFTMRFKRDLPLRRSRQMILEALDAGAERVVFTGGEPSIYPHFDELFSLAARLGPNIDVMSNGFDPGWPDERLRMVLAYHKLRLCLAIQGWVEGDFDEARGPGAFETIRAFVARARELRPDVELLAIVVATSENIDQLEEITRYCLDDLAVASLRVDRVVRAGNALERFPSSAALARAYEEKTLAIQARWGERVLTVRGEFESCPVLDYPHSLEVMPVGHGFVPGCAYMLEERDFDMGRVDESILLLTSAERIQRVRRRMAVLLGERRDYMSQRGMFTCVECMERLYDLRAAGELEEALAAADAQAPAPSPAPRPTALPAPRLRDPRGLPMILG